MSGLGGRSRSSPDQSRTDRPDGGSDFFLLLRNSHIFASMVREALQLGPLRRANRPLTPSQSHLLRLLCTDGGRPVGHVARVLGVSAPASSRTIDALERLDLVVRTHAKGDRRTTLLSASPSGRRWVRRYERAKKTRLAAALRGLEPGEVSALADLLERVSIGLLRGERPNPATCLRCDAYIEAGCAVGRLRGGCPYQEYRGRAASNAVTGQRSGR